MSVGTADGGDDGFFGAREDAPLPFEDVLIDDGLFKLGGMTPSVGDSSG